jgi:hypothetical protein
MRARQLFVLISLVLVGNVALADLDRSDVPEPCNWVCQSVVSASERCDNQTSDDSAEMQCMCDMDQASTQIPLCEACIAQYRADNPSGDDGDDDPHDNGK